MVSTLLLGYCLLLICLSYFQVEPDTFILAIFELITIPVLLLLCIFMVKITLDWKRNGFKLDMNDFLPLIPLVLAALSLIGATVLNI